MSIPSTRLLNWSQPAVEAVVDLLADSWDRSTPLDLCDLLVLTQTKEAGRRLRMALARHADEAGQGVFPPRFATPSVLFAASEGKPVASEVACLLHWEQVIAQANLSDFDSLFPKPPAGQVAAWSRTVGKSLHKLRRTLSDGDWDCAKVASAENLLLKEEDRWGDLAALESRYRESLSENGLLDPVDLNREAAREPELPAGVNRVLLLGVSGFPGLAEIALQRLVERGVEVEVVSFGPANEKFHDLFDDWGRPRREAWETRPVPLQNDQLFLFPDERAQARAVIDALQAYGSEPMGRVALGVIDAELKPFLQQVAEERETSCSLSDPEGTAVPLTPFYALLSALAELVSNPSFRQAAAFLRFPDARRWLESEGVSVDDHELLTQLDRLLTKRLPVTLNDALGLGHSGVREALQRLAQLVASLQGDSFAASLRDFVIGATAGREFHPGEAEDASYLFLASTFSETLTDFETTGPISGETAFPLLLETLRKMPIPGELDPQALPMQGWLELPWETAPRLLLAGLNEGCVPEPMPGDAFLPENLRRELRLWTSEDRFSRDAYLLQWALASRVASGQVDLLLGKWRSGGDPLRPSRLLFLCDPDAEHALPERAKHLFRSSSPGEKNPAWRFAWQLHPGETEPASSISVTGFSDILTCPYRFHMKRNLGMSKFDPAKNEADNLDFGNLVHAVLQRFGDDEKVRQSADAASIRSFLREALEDEFHRRYGKSAGLPLEQQKKTAWLRLSQAAEVQAEERRRGWIPIAAERTLKEDLNGILVRGRIDRIDRNEHDDSFRVLDYKTSDKRPDQQHWTSAGPDATEFPDYVRFNLVAANGRELLKRWTGLQLPLYRWWAERQGEFAGKAISVGYFNLPAEQEKVGVELWPELDEAMMEKAMACAAGVVADLLAGWSGEPRSNVAYDDFEDIFFHDPKGATMALAAKGDAS